MYIHLFNNKSKQEQIEETINIFKNHDDCFPWWFKKPFKHIIF